MSFLKHRWKKIHKKRGERWVWWNITSFQHFLEGNWLDRGSKEFLEALNQTAGEDETGTVGSAGIEFSSPGGKMCLPKLGRRKDHTHKQHTENGEH